MPSREGFTLIEENFSHGELAPVQLVIDTKGTDINLQQQLEAISYIDSVADVQIGEKISPFTCTNSLSMPILMRKNH